MLKTECFLYSYMPFIFFKWKNVTVFYENACFSSGMKSETFNFARYCSVLFCIHMFLHNFGVLNFELRNLSLVSLEKMTLMWPSNPRLPPILSIHYYYDSTAKYHDYNELFEIIILWTINGRFCRVNLLRKNPKWPRHSPSNEQKIKWLSKCKWTPFLICRTRLLNLLCLNDLGAETLIYDVYFSSFDLYFMVNSKMAVVLHIYK